MRTSLKLPLFTFLSFLLSSCLPARVMAYEEITHDALSRVAAVLSPYCVLFRFPEEFSNNFLRDRFIIDFNQFYDITTYIATDEYEESRTLIDWIAHGAVREDAYQLSPGNFSFINRPLNHFYNPLTNQALTDAPPDVLVFGRNDALTWAWEGAISNYPFPPTINEWDWKHAREYEYKWLTEADPVTRSIYCAKTFEALGHIIHLLQDMAQPQHTRNDAHTFKWLGGDGAPYEYYCAERWHDPDVLAEELKLEKPPIFPVINPSPFDDFIPKAFRAFWDTEQYHGYLPKVGFATLGLAEYSNLNFVTSGTMFTGDSRLLVKKPDGLMKIYIGPEVPLLHRFPYPKLKNTDISQLADESVFFTRVGQDIKSVSDNLLTGWSIYGSDTIDNAFSTGFSQNPYGRFNQVIGLTDENYKAYAKKLLPKAISYSTGLINYFFHQDQGGVGGLQAVDASHYLGEHRLRITNWSKETLQGGGYFDGTKFVGPWQAFAETLDGVRVPLSTYSSFTGTLEPGQSFEIVCDYSEFSTYPPDTLIVFRGSIGDEVEAITSVIYYTGRM